MTTTVHVLGELEAKLAAGEPFGRVDAERVAACADLVAVGMLGEAARKAWRGDQVTFCRVHEVAPGAALVEVPAEAGEVRLSGPAASVDDARKRVRAAVLVAGKVPVTAFTVAELLDLAGGDHLTLVEIARALHEDGLASLAEVPVDLVGDTENGLELLRAVERGGLGTWRATVHRASASERLDLIERAAALQAVTGAFRAFAPLPRFDPEDDAPATGYDDVRTVTMARILCRAIPAIQVDWARYGPKLAQVAIAFGADDLDAVSAIDALEMGHRRSPRQDLERQIRAAFAEPAERNGRYEVRG